MKKKYSTAGAVVAWFAVIAQFWLLIENRTSPIGESIVRFFSYYTILTNLLVAAYFSAQLPQGTNAVKRLCDKGWLTALTTYITVVGLVYQFVLRGIWEPKGLQRVVDELLHSVIPFAFIVYWLLFENRAALRWRSIFSWLVYPLVYCIFVLMRGSFSGFYPYPFIDRNHLTVAQLSLNIAVLICVFVFISAVFISIGKAFPRKNHS